MRALTSSLSTATGCPVREKFAKLTQISTLLNMEKVSTSAIYFRYRCFLIHLLIKLDEIHEFWDNQSGALSWKLSAAVVRQMLALRVDFPVDEISRLTL